MFERTVTIGSKVGLHARPAGIFVKAVTETGLPVTIAKPGGQPVDARSILSVLGLDVRSGDQVILACEREQAVEDLAALLASDLDAADGEARAGGAKAA
jgi:phosphocarrier protein